MKRLLALLVMAQLGLGVAACGGKGKGASSSNVTATGGAAAATASTTAPTEGESKLDKDKDNDNPTNSYYDADDEPILHYGRATSAPEEREVAAVVMRYYKAAVADDGATVCSLLYSALAESVPEEYGEAPGPPALRGKTCPVVMSKLVRQHHRQLAAELLKLEVTGARAEGDRGWALLSFGPAKPPGRVLLQREGAAWRIAELQRTEMP
jgi:hypothetical protein